MRKIMTAGLVISALSLGTMTAASAAGPEYFPNGGGIGNSSRNGVVSGSRAPNGNGGGGFRGGGRQFGGGGGYRRFNGGGGGYRRGGGYGGAAVGAGIAGLAAGALIGGAIANQQTYYGGGYDGGYGYNGGYGYAPPVYAASPPVVAEEDDETPVTGDPRSYCASRYRSYDPSSGTYLGFDGDRHPCP